MINIMASPINIEHRLIELDKEIRLIFDMLKTGERKKASAVLESSCGAWDYDVDSETFVDQLRKSTRLDWIK